MNVERELDRLYEAAPGAFVAERNKLVQALRKSGEKSAADEIARLSRTNAAAWAVNQLHFREPALLARLRKAGAALRKAQESADTERFAARKQEYQEALAAATDRAIALAEDAGVGTAASIRRKVEMTLTVWSTAAEDASPAPGRMTADLEPLGFDAFTTMPPAPPPKPAKVTKTSESAEEATHGKKLAAVKHALDAAEKELRRLERECERSRSALERAEEDLRDAERRVETARRARDEARKDTDGAEERVQEAQRALDDARRELAKLSR